MYNVRLHIPALSDRVPQSNTLSLPLGWSETCTHASFASTKSCLAGTSLTMCLQSYLLLLIGVLQTDAEELNTEAQELLPCLASLQGFKLSW